MDACGSLSRVWPLGDVIEAGANADFAFGDGVALEAALHEGVFAGFGVSGFLGLGRVGCLPHG